MNRGSPSGGEWFEDAQACEKTRGEKLTRSCAIDWSTPRCRLRGGNNLGKIQTTGAYGSAMDRDLYSSEG